VIAQPASQRDWPPVVIDATSGRDSFQSDSRAALRKVLKTDHRFWILGPGGPDPLCVDLERAGK